MCFKACSSRHALSVRIDDAPSIRSHHRVASQLAASFVNIAVVFHMGEALKERLTIETPPHPRDLALARLLFEGLLKWRYNSREESAGRVQLQLPVV